MSELKEIKSEDIQTDIWSHPMNKGLSQHLIDHFNATLQHLDSYPKNENGQRIIDGKKFYEFMRSKGALIIDSPNIHL